MSDTSTYDQLKNMTLPSSSSGMFVDFAAKEIRDVLDFGNISSKENIINDFDVKGYLNSEDIFNKSVEISSPYLMDTTATEETILGTNFTTMAKDLIISTVTDNVSKVIESLSGEETSTLRVDELAEFDDYDLTFGNQTGENNGTFFRNLTAVNSTMTGQRRDLTVVRDSILIGGVVFICAVIVFAHYIYKIYSKGDDDGEAYYPSEVMVRYKARYPESILEETELETFNVGSDGETEPKSEAGPSSFGGEIRKTEALVHYTPTKSKGKNDYKPIPTSWDMDGKIVSEAGFDHVVNVGSDCETEPKSEAGPSSFGGEIRKTKALVHCTTTKSKSKNDYTPIPLSWDLDGKIVSEAGIDQVVNDIKVKDSETQTNPDDFYEVMNNMANEQFEKLKAECEGFEFMDD